MNILTNKVQQSLCAIFVLLGFLFPSLFVFATSISFPGTPPQLNLVVKNIEIEPGFKITEGKYSGPSFSAFFIERKETTSVRPYLEVVSIQKEGPGIKVYRMGEFSVEINQKLEHYPAISLISKSDSIIICEAGYYSNCQQRTEKFRGLGGLEIYRTRETYEAFYNHYKKTHTILSLPDWQVEGKVIGDEKDKNKTITEFTIQGNFNFSPPSDDWIAAWEKYQERRAASQRNFYISLGIIVTILVAILVSIVRKIIRKRRGLLRTEPGFSERFLRQSRVLNKILDKFIHLTILIESNKVIRFFVVFIISLPGTLVLSFLLYLFFPMTYEATIEAWLPRSQAVILLIILENAIKFSPLIFSGILAYFISKLRTAFIFTIATLIIVGAIFFLIFSMGL